MKFKQIIVLISILLCFSACTPIVEIEDQALKDFKDHIYKEYENVERIEAEYIKPNLTLRKENNMKL